MFDSIIKLIKYGYFRYLLVTELYMVEHWERVFIHCFFFVVFTLLSLFNSGVILNMVDYFVKMGGATVNVGGANAIFENSAHGSVLGEL